MKRGGRGFKNGPSFCHYCSKQLQAKAGGGFYFVQLLTPVDHHSVRVHINCRVPALKDNYGEPTCTS